MRLDRVCSTTRAATVIALALIGAGCATPADSSGSASQRHLTRAVAVLEKRTDADSLAAAGVLSSISDKNRALSLLARANQAAPDRADLAWLEAQVCSSVERCDPSPMEQRLRALDPSNGAGWLGELARGQAANDDQAIDAALGHIAKSDRVDIYWTTLIARLTDAAVRDQAIPDSDVSIIGVLAAQGIPAYQHAVNSCNGDRAQRPGVVEECRGLARAFENGDTYITEMTGNAIAQRVWPENSPQWTSAADARRVYRYRADILEKLNASPAAPTADRLYVSLCSQYRREQDVLRAQLIAMGKNPDPPSN